MGRLAKRKLNEWFAVAKDARTGARVCQALAGRPWWLADRALTSHLAFFFLARTSPSSPTKRLGVSPGSPSTLLTKKKAAAE